MQRLTEKIVLPKVSITDCVSDHDGIEPKFIKEKYEKLLKENKKPSWLSIFIKKLKAH